MARNGEQRADEPVHGVTIGSRDVTPPPRSTTTGRGHGNGAWLEWELSRALDRWGYTRDENVRVYGVEVDVVARRRHPHNEPSDWILAECKDWADRAIPEEVIFRLCMLAFTCKAMPVLCHTSTLTERAAEIARNWEVRVLRYEDLQRGSLPGPQVVDFRGRGMYSAAVTPTGVRTMRGRVPPMFRGRPVEELSYVPGFKPEGEFGQYEPIAPALITTMEDEE